MPKLRLGELAELISCRLEGDGEVIITGVNTIEAAGPGELTFVHNEKYIPAIATCRASAIVVPAELDTPFRPLLRSPEPYISFGEAMRIFLKKRERPQPGIHSTASVDPTAFVHPTASIGPFCVIGSGVQIGEEVTILAGTQIGEGAVLGARSWIYPNVVIGQKIRTGENVIIHSGCVLMSDPTGARVQSTGTDDTVDVSTPPFLIEIGREVEIGANVTIESGVRKPTRIGPGTKIDNLVYVGSEAQVGDDCIIVAQVSIGRGAFVGNNVTLAGQVAIESKRRVGDDVMVGAKSLVSDDVEDRQVVSGIPAIRHDLDLRLKAHLRRLPTLFKKMEAFQKGNPLDQVTREEME